MNSLFIMNSQISVNFWAKKRLEPKISIELISDIESKPALCN